MRLVEIRDGWIVDVDSISEVAFKPKRELVDICTDDIAKKTMIYKTFYYVEIVISGREHEISFDSEEETREFYDRFLKDFCKEKWV